jgi:hypothetical protein
MPRRSNRATAQVEALRTLADELEAGTRELSPAMAKALERELARDDDGHYEELTAEEWEEAWAKEIDHRLAAYRAGTSQKVDLGALLDDLRSRIR